MKPIGVHSVDCSIDLTKEIELTPELVAAAFADEEAINLAAEMHECTIDDIEEGRVPFLDEGLFETPDEELQVRFALDVISQHVRLELTKSFEALGFMKFDSDYVDVSYYIQGA